jgi:hypothetical protein
LPGVQLQRELICLAVTKERRIVEGKYGWRHRARGRRDFNVGADLLQQRGISKKIVSPHSVSPLKCQTAIARIRTGFPVAGHPINVPRWVPRHSFSETTQVSSAQDTADAHRKVLKALPMAFDNVRRSSLGRRTVPARRRRR